MKLYFANIYGATGLEEYLRFDIDVLSAFPSFPKKGPEKPPFCDDLFVDSGAFGKHGDKVDLDSYCKFLKEYSDKIDLYANLDVIGDAEGSYRNLRKMENRGLDPLPVFHYGSNEFYLRKIISEYDYIALGGLVPITTNKDKLKEHLDYVWEVILQEKPDLKVHGFGINSIDIMKRFPWYSVDASSVHVLARYGGVYTPNGTLKINPNVNAEELKWQNLKPTQKEIIKEFVNDYASPYTYEDAKEQSTEGTLIRCAVSIHYMTEVMENYDWQANQPKTKQGRLGL